MNPYELGTKASLALQAAFVPVFVLARRMFDGHVSAGSARALCAQADALLREERERLLCQGVLERWVDAVQRPVIALLDEAAQRCPTSGFSEAWPPLSIERYGNLTLGRDVFVELGKLREDKRTPAEVLEVYLKCLSMGMEGEHHAARGRELELIFGGLRQELCAAQAEPDRDLSPDLIEAVACPPRLALLRKRWVLALALLSTVALWLTLSLSLHATAWQVEDQLMRTLSGAPVQPVPPEELP